MYFMLFCYLLAKALVFYEFDCFCKYIGYRNFLEFLFLKGESSRLIEARERLIKKAHLLTYQGLRTIQSIHEEHGIFNETERMKLLIGKIKLTIEEGEDFRLPPFKNKALLKIGGESGQKLKAFIKDWNKFQYMSYLLRIYKGEKRI